jgi:hypothetical protein
LATLFPDRQPDSNAFKFTETFFSHAQANSTEASNRFVGYLRIQAEIEQPN